jgi:uncharacterized membrane protein YfcA
MLLLFFISTFCAVIGIGGGVIYVPLFLACGLPFARASALSLIVIAVAAVSASVNHWKIGRIDWKLALVVELPCSLMAFVGGYYSGIISVRILKGLLAVILVIAGAFMIYGRPTSSSEVRGWWLWHRTFDGREYTVNLSIIIFASTLIGLLSGMLGVTGGIIKLPVMVVLCGVPMDIAVATSTLMVSITALSGLAGHFLVITIDWMAGTVLALAALTGGWLGSKISLNLDKEKLRGFFGVVLWLIAVRIVYTIL